MMNWGCRWEVNVLVAVDKVNMMDLTVLRMQGDKGRGDCVWLGCGENSAGHDEEGLQGASQ